MSCGEFEKLVKLLIIGDSGIGKTCLLLRFAEDKFQAKHISTIGIDYKNKIIEIKKSRVKI
jgi:GTPase SAR1 family protein